MPGCAGDLFQDCPPASIKDLVGAVSGFEERARMFEELTFLLQQTIFTGNELGGLQFLQLEPHPFHLSGVFLLEPFELDQAIAGCRPVLETAAYFGDERSEVAEIIKGCQMGFRVHELLVLMLPGYGEEPPGQLLKLLQSYLLIVDEDPVPAAPADAASHLELDSRFEFQLRESGFKACLIRKGKGRFDGSFR